MGGLEERRQTEFGKSTLVEWAAEKQTFIKFEININ